MYLLDESLDIFCVLTESRPSAVCLFQHRKWHRSCRLQRPVKLM